MPIAPTIDVVIAVHDPSRPVTRAVRSVLHDAVAGVRVLVVCHGIASAAFEVARAEFADAPVEWLEFSDGVPSPTGPFMHGLRSASADYVAIMGSDDFLEPGAVEASARLLEADAPDALILPLRHQGGEMLRNPLARKGRVRSLDAVRDRLAYRSAPLAFLRRGLLDELSLELTPGLASGEDLEFSARLWFSDARVDFHPAAPSYVIGADAEARVTTTPRPAEIELEAVRRLIGRDWVRASASAARNSLVIKLLRIHVLGAVLRRIEGAGAVPDGDLAAYGEFTRAATALAPRAMRPFARADRRILDSLAAVPFDAGSVLAAARAHGGAGRFDQLLPRNPLLAFDREGTLRRFLRYRTWP
ncbi:hypothetical protein BJ978_001973 [Agromyces terreus]|uniref:Glycosyltransferase 2-like domain-containing protein n=1 Tax=Agromyces terreus TaxID=424795 RepID=A0A9X2H5S4_9MICO|nr:glycosyltransferase [Agromyces terreus]MCP2371297.1 hypothetical protein [Agromyces terreus]